MFRSYQVVLLIEGLLSYSHFIVYEKISSLLVLMFFIVKC